MKFCIFVLAICCVFALQPINAKVYEPQSEKCKIFNDQIQSSDPKCHKSGFLLNYECSFECTKPGLAKTSNCEWRFFRPNKYPECNDIYCIVRDTTEKPEYTEETTSEETESTTEDSSTSDVVTTWEEPTTADSNPWTSDSTTADSAAGTSDSTTADSNPWTSDGTTADSSEEVSSLEPSEEVPSLESSEESNYEYDDSIVFSKFRKV